MFAMISSIQILRSYFVLFCNQNVCNIKISYLPRSDGVSLLDALDAVWIPRPFLWHVFSRNSHANLTLSNLSISINNTRRSISCVFVRYSMCVKLTKLLMVMRRLPFDILPGRERPNSSPNNNRTAEASPPP